MNRLFHQGADGKFSDVSAGSGLDVAGYGMGVAIGDINNDGQARYSDAEVSYREAVRINPKLAEAWFNLGLCLINQRDSEHAIEAFQNATRFKPDLTYAYIRWGLALGRLRRVPEAIEQLQRALQLSPTNQEAREMLEILLRSPPSPPAK